MLPMVLMPLLGAWFMAVIPADSRQYATGGSVAMTMFMALAVGASVLIGGYAVIGLWRQKLYINGATATLLTALAFGATAGGEFVREGVRKPYTIRTVLYSNSLQPADVALMRRIGSVTLDPYPLLNEADYPNEQLRTGAKVYRFQCSVCHTLDGVNGVTHLTKTWSTDQKRMNLAQLQFTKPFMPPFAGNAAELEALVQLLEWEHQHRPRSWPPSTDETVRQRIEQWLQEAGTGPGYPKLLTREGDAGAGPHAIRP